MATHSSILAWKIPWSRILASYSPWGRRVGLTERLSTRTHWLIQEDLRPLPAWALTSPTQGGQGLLSTTDDSATVQGLSACQAPQNSSALAPRAGDSSRLGPLSARSAPIAQSPGTASGQDAGVSGLGLADGGSRRARRAGAGAGGRLLTGAPARPGGAGRAPAAPGGGSGHGHWPPSPEEMVTHSNILAWRIQRTEEPGRLNSTGPHRAGHNRSDLARVHIATSKNGIGSPNSI